MKRKILLTMLLCGFSAFLSASSPLLVRDGKPEAVIVIPEKASLTEEFAASQLRYWLREITGAELEITGKPADGKTGIFLGRSFAEKMFPDDIRKLDGTEGFAIREKDGNLYFFCGLPCGLNFAVYDFLEKNTDIIWPCYRTGFDRVFTPVRTLSANVCDYREIPAFRERTWGINNGYYYNHPQTEYFTLRLKTDGAHGSSAPRTRFGFTNDDRTCHNLWRYLPWSEYKDSHPEYFCLINGKRVNSFDSNLCFMAPGGAEEFAKNFIRDRIENGVPCRIAGIGINDTNETCRCELCEKPVKLDDGTLLTREMDENKFKSAQYYMWLNRVVKEINRKYPDFKVATIAYMFTETPPGIKVDDHIEVIFCPIGKNIKQDFHGASNQVVLKKINGWLQNCEGLRIYEYWGCAAGYPRPVSYVIQRDLKFMRENGIRKLYSEWSMQNNGDFMSCPEFWVTCRLMWDPDQDIEALRDEFFRKTFRGAAKDMRTFYDIIRDRWYADGSSSFYYDNPVNSTLNYLMQDETAVPACRKALDDAVAHADHPVSRAFAEKIRECFELLVTEASGKKQKTGKLEIPLTNCDDARSINGGSWGRALETTDFFHMWRKTERSPQDLRVRLLCDGTKLYLKFHADKLTFPLRTDGQMFGREHWEIFLRTDASDASVPYYQFAFDPAGVRYSGIGYSKQDFCDWELILQKEEDSWDAIVIIPLKDLKFNGSSGQIHFMHTPDAPKQAFFSLFGNTVHETGAMSRFTVEKEK